MWHDNVDVLVGSLDPDAAADYFGFLAAFFPMDMSPSSARTQELLGSTRRDPGLIADVEEGHHFAVT
jgi:hypothetical protein